MERKKQDSSPKDANSNNSPKMLSMEELKIISDMVMKSLREDLAKMTLGSADTNPFASDESYYADSNEDPSDITEYTAHKAQEQFYSVNSPSECPMCGSKIQRFGHYNLEFGTNIRKKASFCGIDCLQQFINELSYSKGF
jgi:hypothetical protein